MTTERKHRCGGMLQSRDVQVQNEMGSIVLVYRVPGLVCDACREELIDRETLLTLEKSQIPTVVWNTPATSHLSTRVFDEKPASTAIAA